MKIGCIIAITHHLTTFTQLLEVSLDVRDPQELFKETLDCVLST